MVLSVTCFLWMDPNSSVHGQSWQDQKLTERSKQKSSIKISTAATDSRILMQKSLSHLSKSFREMPSYTKLTYFIIHRGPRVWIFFSSALLLLFRRSSIHITSKLHEKQWCSSYPLCEHKTWVWQRLQAHFPYFSHWTALIHTTKPTQLLQKIKIHQALTPRKSRDKFPKEKARSPIGQHWE